MFQYIEEPTLECFTLEAPEATIARLRAENAALVKKIDCGPCDGVDEEPCGECLDCVKAEAAMHDRVRVRVESMVLDLQTSDATLRAQLSEKEATLSRVAEALDEQIQECRRVEAKFSHSSDAFISAASERRALQGIQILLELQ